MNNRQDLQRKLEQTKHLSALAGDLTTRQRLFDRDELIEALEKPPQRPEHITEMRGGEQKQQPQQKNRGAWEHMKKAHEICLGREIANNNARAGVWLLPNDT